MTRVPTARKVGTVAGETTAPVGTGRRGEALAAGRAPAWAHLDPDRREEGLRSALVLWDYLCLDASPKAADCIFVMGGHDKGVAEHAATLYRHGLAPLVAVSGGAVNPPSMLERGSDRASEAEELADVLIAGGVPSELALREHRATNSGENFRFTDELFAERGLAIDSAMIVTKPYCERRALATARKCWPARVTTIGSHRRSFYDYLMARIPLERVLSMMVGEVDRLRTYGERNFIAPVTVPSSVLAAAEALRRDGYTARGIPA